MAHITEIEQIRGALIVDLQAFGDERGSFMETFRQEWFPQRAWSKVQTNRSESVAGVLRGLHYHLAQVDYWHVVRGELRAGLADLRPASPTYLGSHTIELSGDRPQGLFVPVGVAHGFFTVADAVLTYVVDNYHDGSDEFGVAWDDPQLDVDWRVRKPTLSARDRSNPYLADIPPENLPR